MYSQLTRELRNAYNSIYLQENNIDEIRENIKYFMDILLEEGFDIGEMNEDDLYHLYQFCIDETIDLNEGPLSFMKGIVKDPRVQQAALKYGGKLYGALKTGAKEVLKVPEQGVKNIGKALIKPLQTKVGSVAATLAGAEALLAGEKSKVRQAAGQVGPALTALKKTVYGDDQQPATAKQPEKPPEKPKPQSTSKLYEYAAGSTPLTVSGGRTGTGVGKDFKARSWSQAEVEKYKKSRGAAQIAKDKAAQAQARKGALQLAADEKATPKDEFAQSRRKPDGDLASRSRREPPTVKSKPEPKPPAPAQTGDRTKDLSTWAKANKPMIQKVGTPQQRAVLSAAEKGTAMPAPRPISKDIEDLKGMQKASQERQAAQSGPMYSSPDVKSKMSARAKNILGVKEQYDAYDVVLEYLLSQGHVDTLEEALYVMMEMPAETIQSIIEQSNTLVTPEQRRADELKYGMRRTTQVPPSKPPATVKTGPKPPRMPL